MPQQHLSEQEIRQIHQLLTQLYVPLEDKAIQGLSYARERLTLCRAMQDQVHDIRLRVMVAYSHVQKELIFAKSEQLQADTAQAVKQAKLKVMELQQLNISHKTLNQQVTAHNSLLTSTQRDIKTLIDVIKEQVRLAEIGGVDPHDAEEALVTQADLSQIGKPIEEPLPQIDLEQFMEPEPEVVPEDQIPESALDTFDPEPGEEFLSEGPEPPAVAAPVLAFSAARTGGDDFADLFAAPVPLQPAAVSQPLPTLPMTPTPLPVSVTVEMVGFGDDVVVGTPIEALPRGMPVPDLSSVPIESLFEEDTYGGTPTPSHRAF